MDQTISQFVNNEGLSDIHIQSGFVVSLRINGIIESDYFIKKISQEITPEELNFLNEEFSALIEEKIPVPVEVESND